MALDNDLLTRWLAAGTFPHEAAKVIRAAVDDIQRERDDARRQANAVAELEDEISRLRQLLEEVDDIADDYEIADQDGLLWRLDRIRALQPQWREGTA
jgi:hypothetical protein